MCINKPESHLHLREVYALFDDGDDHETIVAICKQALKALGDIRLAEDEIARLKADLAATLAPDER